MARLNISFEGERQTLPVARPKGMSGVLILATIASGLLTRFGPLGLPPIVAKYGGSLLWALAVYWILSTFLPQWRVSTVALLAAALAVCVELIKLYHSPFLNVFRLTLPGKLLLGRFFSIVDILAYWVAIVVGAILDQRFLRRS